MTVLLASIDFSMGGNGERYVLEGWAEPETGHRWTMGQESRVVLPVRAPGPGCILVITATPCLNFPVLTAQSVMLALNGRLLETVQIEGLLTMSFAFPHALEKERDIVLSISHLSAGKPRSPAQVRQGQPLGLMMHTLRVFQLSAIEQAVPPMTALPGLRPGPSLRREVERRTGLPLRTLAENFESMGQGCQFGLVQRHCGAEPLGLLRFVETVTSRLVDGLLAGFAGVENADRLDLTPTADAQPRWAWRQQDYGLTYDTRLVAASSDAARVAPRQAQRLGFLRRKFVEDLASAEKIFVLTRGDCLTRSEAFAVSCALRVHGPVTLLWTVFGNEAEAGRVDLLARGFLRGQLGKVDRHGYGSLDAWLCVMSNAFVMGRQAVLF